MKRVAILGAGFGGMAAAYDLSRAGYDVTIFEAEDHVGGLASGFKEPHWDWSVEKYYHHWFVSDEHMMGIISELGLSEKVLFPRPLTVMYYKGKFYPFDSIPNAIKFPGLPSVTVKFNECLRSQSSGTNCLLPSIGGDFWAFSNSSFGSEALPSATWYV